MELSNHNQEVLEHYSAPTKLCRETYGQIWKHLLDNNDYALYIQISKDPEEPIWVKMGDFLEKVYDQLVLDKKFIDNCLKLLEKGKE